MVNSGSFDSEGDRNAKSEFTQPNSAVESPQSVSPVPAASACLREHDFTTRTADSLPVSQAIEPTATKTEFKCNMSGIIRNCDVSGMVSCEETTVIKTQDRSQDILKAQKCPSVQNAVDGQKLQSATDRNCENSGCLGNSPESNVKNSVYCRVPLHKVQNILKKLNVVYNNHVDVDPGAGLVACVDSKSISKKLMCLYCERTFITQNLKQKHVDRYHSAKHGRRSSMRRQNKQVITPCMFCNQFDSNECSLDQLFEHLVTVHPTKYFGCLHCRERFSTAAVLRGHTPCLQDSNDTPNTSIVKPDFLSDRLDIDTPNSRKSPRVKLNRKVKEELKGDTEINETPHEEPAQNAIAVPEITDDKNITAKKTKAIPPSKKNAMNKKVNAKQFARTTRLRSKILEDAKISKKRTKSTKVDQNSDKPFTEKNSTSSGIHSYPTFDFLFRVKKITDHSIDNLRISSMTFEDVFDKAFYNRVKSNIRENLLNFIDGKLFKNVESENRISSFERSCQYQPEIPSLTASDNYGCDISLNAVAPIAPLLSTSQFGEDLESQIEYGSKASKKRVTTTSDEVHYKYFTRRKYQAVISESKKHRDLSKLDMWTQLAVNNRQHKIINEQKTAKERIEYAKSEEYKAKMQVEELDRILDKRAPFEDLKEESIRKVAFEKLNVVGASISLESYFDVTVIVNELLNKVFTLEQSSDNVEMSSSTSLIEERELSPEICSEWHKNKKTEITSYLNLRRSSQEDSGNSKPTQEETENNHVELTGEWARSRIYICASCGIKLPTAKTLVDHKNFFHQYVWCQHYEFVGNQSELYTHLSIPGLGKVGELENNAVSKFFQRSDARVCSKCSKRCNCLGDLHRHVLECGGDWSWMLVRKKCKYRPYGSKPRRKKRGLLKLLSMSRERKEGEFREKKKYKTRFEGPRPKPSDAESIQRMLANLPPKRTSRKVISLKDGHQNLKKGQSMTHPSKMKSLKNLAISFNQNLQNKIKGNGQKNINLRCNPKRYLRSSNREGLHSFVEGQNNVKYNTGIKRRSVRNITKVLASKILKSTTPLITKCKLRSFIREKLNESHLPNLNKSKNNTSVDNNGKKPSLETIAPTKEKPEKNNFLKQKLQLKLMKPKMKNDKTKPSSSDISNTQIQGQNIENLDITGEVSKKKSFKKLMTRKFTKPEVTNRLRKTRSCENVMSLLKGQDSPAPLANVAPICDTAPEQLNDNVTNEKELTVQPPPIKLPEFKAEVSKKTKKKNGEKVQNKINRKRKLKPEILTLNTESAVDENKIKKLATPKETTLKPNLVSKVVKQQNLKSELNKNVKGIKKESTNKRNNKNKHKLQQTGAEDNQVVKPLTKGKRKFKLGNSVIGEKKHKHSELSKIVEVDGPSQNRRSSKRKRKVKKAHQDSNFICGTSNEKSEPNQSQNIEEFSQMPKLENFALLSSQNTNDAIPILSPFEQNVGDTSCNNDTLTAKESAALDEEANVASTTSLSEMLCTEQSSVEVQETMPQVEENQDQLEIVKDEEESVCKDKEDNLSKVEEESVCKDKEDSLPKDEEESLCKDKEDSLPKDEEESLCKDKEDSLSKDEEENVCKDKEESLGKDEEESLNKTDDSKPGVTVNFSGDKNLPQNSNLSIADKTQPIDPVLPLNKTNKKVKKLSRGLNDCIAMLTSKLQQQICSNYNGFDKNEAKVESLEVKTYNNGSECIVLIKDESSAVEVCNINKTNDIDVPANKILPDTEEAKVETGILEAAKQVTAAENDDSVCEYNPNKKSVELFDITSMAEKEIQDTSASSGTDLREICDVSSNLVEDDIEAPKTQEATEILEKESTCITAKDNEIIEENDEAPVVDEKTVVDDDETTVDAKNETSASLTDKEDVRFNNNAEVLPDIILECDKTKTDNETSRAKCKTMVKLTVRRRRRRGPKSRKQTNKKENLANQNLVLHTENANDETTDRVSFNSNDIKLIENETVPVTVLEGETTDLQKTPLIKNVSNNRKRQPKIKIGSKRRIRNKQKNRKSRTITVRNFIDSTVDQQENQDVVSEEPAISEPDSREEITNINSAEIFTETSNIIPEIHQSEPIKASFIDTINGVSKLTVNGQTRSEFSLVSSGKENTSSIPKSPKSKKCKAVRPNVTPKRNKQRCLKKDLVNNELLAEDQNLLEGIDMSPINTQIESFDHCYFSDSDDDVPLLELVKKDKTLSVQPVETFAFNSLTQCNMHETPESTCEFKLSLMINKGHSEKLDSITDTATVEDHRQNNCNLINTENCPGLLPPNEESNVLTCETADVPKLQNKRKNVTKAKTKRKSVFKTQKAKRPRGSRKVNNVNIVLPQIEVDELYDFEDASSLCKKLEGEVSNEVENDCEVPISNLESSKNEVKEIEQITSDTDNLEVNKVITKTTSTDSAQISEYSSNLEQSKEELNTPDTSWYSKITEAKQSVNEKLETSNNLESNDPKGDDKIILSEVHKPKRVGKKEHMHSSENHEMISKEHENLPQNKEHETQSISDKSSHSVSNSKQKLIDKKLKKRNVKSKSAKVSVPESLENKPAYCEICHKTFARLENLLKHKRTLTHIAKLSELEAIEASEKSQQFDEQTESENAVPDFTAKCSLNINDILCNTDQLFNSKMQQNEISTNSLISSFALGTTRDSLKLADIINDVLSKPVDNDLMKHNSFSELLLQSPMEQDRKRYRSLGERKSFDSDNMHLFSNTESAPLSVQNASLDSNFTISKLPSSADSILAKQISLLENIIEESRTNAKCLNGIFDSSKTGTDDNSRISSVSELSELDNLKQESSHQISFSRNTLISEDNLITSAQYEEISEDSTSVRHQYDEQKSRKVLNRDEELFLECCSLLKSSSEISDLPKKTRKTIPFLNNFDLKPCDESEWLESKSLQNSSGIFESNFSHVSTPTSDICDDFSDSITMNSWTLENNENSDQNKSCPTFKEQSLFEDISSESKNCTVFTDNLSGKLAKTAEESFQFHLPYDNVNENSDLSTILDEKNKSTPPSSGPKEFEEKEEIDIELKNQVVSRFGGLMAKALKSKIHTLARKAKRRKKKSDTIQSSIMDYAVSMKKKKSTAKSELSKKMLTKGAMKVFEGLKVSIPKEGLDMNEVMNCSPTSKRIELQAEKTCTNNIVDVSVSDKNLTLKQSDQKTLENNEKRDVNSLNNVATKRIFRRFGNKLGLRVTKKKNLQKVKSNKICSISHDVYDFEETQDNVDVFCKTSLPVYRSYKTMAKSNETKDGDSKSQFPVDDKLNFEDSIDSDSETNKHQESLAFEAHSGSSLSATSLASNKLSKEKNITKNKCMIMGRIFKNALKSKLEDNIRDIPSIENSKLVEKYILHCPELQSEKESVHKMSDVEMNLLFDKLLDEDKSEEKSVSKELKEKMLSSLKTMSATKGLPKTVKHKQKTPKMKKRQRKNSASSTDEEFNIQKSARRRVSKKNCAEQNGGINLEQELKECIGVASRKSQRKCTSGKQNVLVEFWSSDESNSGEKSVELTANMCNIEVNNEQPQCVDITTNSEDIVISQNLNDVDESLCPKPIAHEEEAIENTETSVSACVTDDHKTDVDGIKPASKIIKRKKLKGKSAESRSKMNNHSKKSDTIATNRRKRTAVDTLYYWSSSSEDELQDMIEVKPIREETDDAERPLQHGWIVGDSPKKLVTMLAQAKGKKLDGECVKQQTKKRTSI